MSEKTNEVLLVIDVQRDFLPDGSLAVPEGDAVLPVINRLGARFHNVVLTQDWHPAGHISFSSTHGLRPFADTFEASYGTQTLWPDHTVQGSPGAELHPGLILPNANLIVRKGFRKDVDSYSAFLENDHRTSTGLAGYLRDRGLTSLFLCGLAWDYCVGYSALDGVALGFQVTVIEDAVRGIAPETMAAMSARWDAVGVKRIQSAQLLG
ncbi:bifunctional nicotinamidase/pyrazinamidase [Terriglobus roseus]|uniref:Nicotinamidase n=1 Tax=Terriglobus roseus TaxID=392734 RepID=A0A1H4KLT3_9BACT|nr:bifunctional nicotinamidase/pyrazinamidase [Terriglobus roseus]SEB58872.1 nicotinamidase/pyrazinamidase [Terriglobus roseus]